MFGCNSFKIHSSSRKKYFEILNTDINDLIWFYIPFTIMILNMTRKSDNDNWRKTGFVWLHSFYIRISKFRPRLGVLNISRIWVFMFLILFLIFKHRKYMMKLDVLKFYLVSFMDAGIVLSLFLILAILNLDVLIKLFLKKVCNKKVRIQQEIFHNSERINLLKSFEHFWRIRFLTFRNLRIIRIVRAWWSEIFTSLYYGRCKVKLLICEIFICEGPLFVKGNLR